jgi:hypothetical protein
MPGKGVRNRFRAELSETVPDTFSRQGLSGTGSGRGSDPPEDFQRQQRLNFLPLPQGQASLREILAVDIGLPPVLGLYG